MADSLFLPLGDTDRKSHLFRYPRAIRLPDNLLVGPPPDIQSRQTNGVTGVQSYALSNQFPEPWRSLIYGVQRKGNFISVVGTVGTVAQLIRPAEERTYVIIQNTSVANQLFVSFGYAPQNTGSGVTGLILAANGGNYEPAVIPQEDIWVLGNAANTQFVLYVAQG